MSKLFSFRYKLKFLTFWSNTLAIPKRDDCTHGKKTSDTCHKRWPTGEVLIGRVRLFGDSLASKGGGRGGGG